MIDRLKNDAEDEIWQLYVAMAKDVSSDKAVKVALITKSSVTAKRNIEKIVRQYYGKLFAVINSYTAKAWFAGEEHFNSGVKKAIPKVSKALADKGIFEHRENAMKRFIINKDEFQRSSMVWRREHIIDINNAIEIAIKEGKGAKELARDLKQYLVNPDKLTKKMEREGMVRATSRGVYKSPFQNALRLAKHEMNKSYTKAEWESMQVNPAIIGFNIWPSERHRILDICDYAKGVYPKSFQWNLWHVGCFCTITPIYADQKELDKITSSILRGEDMYQPKQITTLQDNVKKYFQDNKKEILKMRVVPSWFTNNKRMIG